MPMILDPNWQRGYLIPYGRDKRTGQGGLAVPGVVQDMLSALMLPGDVYQGKMPLLDPETGRTSDQVIRGSADLAGMMTLGSGAIPAQPNSLRMGIKAYHGSPHDFDRFSMDKIGTGEGAQAYGHGLYFAENEKVAKGYRDTLAPQWNSYVDGKRASDLGQQTWEVADQMASRGMTPEQFLQHRIDAIEKAKAAGNIERAAAASEILASERPHIEALIGKSVDKGPGGRMYEVNIDANPDDFLDWDRPLKDQPRILEQFGYNEAKYPEDWIPDLNETGADFYRRYAGSTNDNAKQRFDGKVNNQLTGGAPRTIKMKDGTHKNVPLNIPGIKYLDAGSRGAGDGSRNYVVFDENLISIVKKYGVAALVAAGVLDQAQGEELKARGYN